MSFAAIFLTLALAGCIGSKPQASLDRSAPRASSRRSRRSTRGKSFDLEIVNDTKARADRSPSPGRPPLRVSPGQTSTRQIDSLPAGDHKVTLEGAPFEATLRARRE